MLIFRSHHFLLTEHRSSTNSNVSVGVPIFLLNDTKLVDNNADLWDGSINTLLDIGRDGSTLSDDSTVWTGTTVTGIASFYLGSLGPEEGFSGSRRFSWVSTGWGLHGFLDFDPMYAVSDVLTVPGAPVPAIPEPNTLILLGISCVVMFGLTFTQKHRKKVAN